MSGRWPLNGVGGCLFFNLFFGGFFMAFLCVSQQGKFRNTINKFLGEIHVQSFLPKKLRKTKNPVVFSYRFFIAFLAVSLHDEPKNTINHKNIF
jgi:hypothetical protein